MLQSVGRVWPRVTDKTVLGPPGVQEQPVNSMLTVSPQSIVTRIMFAIFVADARSTTILSTVSVQQNAVGDMAHHTQITE